MTGGVTTADLVMLENRVEQLERIYGKNTSEKEAVKILEELNSKVKSNSTVYRIVHWIVMMTYCIIKYLSTNYLPFLQGYIHYNSHMYRLTKCWESTLKHKPS